MRDYRIVSEVLTGDVDVYLDQHPDAFDALLFKAVLSDQETLTEVADEVGSIESLERSISYEDPVPTKAVIIPEQFPVSIVDEGDGPDGTLGQPIVMLIAEKNVPEQSVLRYDEYIDDVNVRTVNLYVLKSEGVNQAGAVAVKHYLIPFPEII